MLQLVNNKGVVKPQADTSDQEQQLAQKKQEIALMQDMIVNDIADKAGKVAVAKGLQVVFKDYRVNASAVDITDEVIAEFKN